MKHKNFYIAALVFISFAYSASAGSADEVHICVSEQDGYAVKVQENEKCHEHESKTIVSGAHIADKNGMELLSEFSSNEECQGEGINSSLGFDENGNGNLEPNEIVTTSSSCSPEVDVDNEAFEASSE